MIQINPSVPRLVQGEDADEANTSISTNDEIKSWINHFSINTDQEYAYPVNEVNINLDMDNQKNDSSK
ncbi:MAG: hypothetical protein PHO27_07755 [Sulfuricurvum sp.]|nr:hypothetical protein [Sulfuricurvum sp.]